LCAGFSDWGFIKINGFPLSLFLDPAYSTDLKLFRYYYKQRHSSPNQPLFFKVHSSSWFTTREFLAIYSTSVTKNSGYSSKDEPIIEKQALALLEQSGRKETRPICRYYGQLTWSTDHIPVLEHATLKLLLDSDVVISSRNSSAVALPQEQEGEEDSEMFSLHLEQQDGNAFFGGAHTNGAHSHSSSQGESQGGTQSGGGGESFGNVFTQPPTPN